MVQRYNLNEKQAAKVGKWIKKDAKRIAYMVMPSPDYVDAESSATIEDANCQDIGSITLAQAFKL
jgi:hypothetical protein